MKEIKALLTRFCYKKRDKKVKKESQKKDKKGQTEAIKTAIKYIQKKHIVSTIKKEITIDHTDIKERKLDEKKIKINISDKEELSKKQQKHYLCSHYENEIDETEKRHENTKRQKTRKRRESGINVTKNTLLLFLLKKKIYPKDNKDIKEI